MKLLALVLIVLSTACSQQTRPERTRYEETSRYRDVIAFIDSLNIGSGPLKRSTLGYSTLGKNLPMIFYGDIPDTKPETIRRSGKLVVYIQGNIHAGEVEGKEALLELLRDLNQGKHGEWKRRVILMIVPIFNADGNDKISLYNRPFQNGPITGMGERANAQGLDLNRDHIKLETPEVRAFVTMMKEYDPDVVVDLHTTNGSFHAYHITYSYTVNPVVDSSLDTFVRTEFFPSVEKKMSQRNFRTHRYGDYLDQTPAGKPGYYFWAHEPRFNSNYVGFRNRLAVLSEAYSYITFEKRIAATKALVESIVEYCSGNSLTIKRILAAADTAASHLQQVDSLSVRAEIVESNPAQEILLAPVRTVHNPYTGEPMYLMNEDSIRKTITSEFYGTRSLRNAKVPLRYYIPDSLKQVLDLLRAHGIGMTRTTDARRIAVQRFRITANRQSENVFQKHTMRTLEGKYESGEEEIPAGSWCVELNQRLSRLAFYLLEPESEDGCVAWNIVDPYLGAAKCYPIVKVTDRNVEQ